MDTDSTYNGEFNGRNGAAPTLNREQLEAMLPDFAFGRLDAKSARQFEDSVRAFPELVQEVEEVQALFAKLETMSYHEDIDQRTRNLSVKVHERMRRNSAPLSLGWVRKLAPVMALCVGIMVFYYNSAQKSVEFQNFDDELASLLAKDPGTVLLVESSADEGMLPLSILPHDLSSNAIAVVQDNDQLEGLMAESIVGASVSDLDQVSSDEQSNEALDLLNSVDIQDVEQQILEVENGEG